MRGVMHINSASSGVMNRNEPVKKINVGRVIANRPLCRSHFRLTVSLPAFAPAEPGQFVHLGPATTEVDEYREFSADGDGDLAAWQRRVTSPMLRRAFSISGFRAVGAGIELDVIYRVVGKGTAWLSKLSSGATVSVLGPLGLPFPIHPEKTHAWMVAGGVGLPPMLWLSAALETAGKNRIAFCGAQTADLLAVTMCGDPAPSADGRTATLSAKEFAASGTPVVISTDDGSLGYHGHIGAALEAYHQAGSCDADDLVVYTCGPERMMAFVARFCLDRGIECYVCMERSMACGTGMCQSCVVPVHDDGVGASAWQYRLCCKDGPVFRAEDVLWEGPAISR